MEKHSTHYVVATIIRYTLAAMTRYYYKGSITYHIGVILQDLICLTEHSVTKLLIL